MVIIHIAQVWSVVYTPSGNNKNHLGDSRSLVCLYLYANDRLKETLAIVSQQHEPLATCMASGRRDGTTGGSADH